MKFQEQHNTESPLLICNVWDVASAKAAESLDFKAIGTSSGAIATMLGYNDGEEISFQELAYIVERIIKTANIPLSVDLVAGYGDDPRKIVDNIIKLSELGVVGINLEDSIVNQKREIISAEIFQKTLNDVCAKLKQESVDMFVNVRTDPFLMGLPNPLEETLHRSRLYEAAGADGIFIPCIEKVEDIEAVVKEVKLPVNVMCMPNLPKFETLKNLGVKRISMGNFVFGKMNKTLETELATIQKNNSFQNLFV